MKTRPELEAAVMMQGTPMPLASQARARLWIGPPSPLLAALAAGLLLRLWWVFHFGQTTNDTRVYGEFARNVLQHGVYGFSNAVNGVPSSVLPTLIRLPGYPIFLMACFRLFGTENYKAVMLVQTAADLWTCLLLGGLAARIFDRRAGIAALWLAALCPFTSNYVAVPLTETLTLFFIALAFYSLLRWRDERARINRWTFVLAFALAYSILLRPEQGLLAAAIVPAMWFLDRDRGALAAMRPALLVSVLTLLPLLPWTVRNWRVFHVFQPLAPRFATDPGELINYGFQRWYRTWAIEFASTENVYWNYGGAPLDIATLPPRAFDSNAQYAATQALLSGYNQTDNPTPALDSRFDAIALERIHAHPLRYFFLLPAARVFNMMFRPRTELMNISLDWWSSCNPPRQRAFALAYATLNLSFFVLAAIPLTRRQTWRDDSLLLAAMLATIVLRTALLLTVDNSEPRYTLEFFPVLIVLGSANFKRPA